MIVDPTEMAGKRRLGRVVIDQPLGPGLHLKLPLIEEIDKLQTSLETYKLDRLTVNTVDNQPITVAVGLTYRIPADAVLKLLYEVGRAGNVDIGENFQRIIAARTAKIFAQLNTTTISENRERLSTALKALLSTDLGRLYGIEVVDFQIAGITYSDSFRASVEAAVKAKNEAVAAENTVNRMRFEAQQAVARANGEAEAQDCRCRPPGGDPQRARSRRSDPPRRRVPGQRAAAQRRGAARQCLGRRPRQSRSMERHPAPDPARRDRGHAAPRAAAAGECEHNQIKRPAPPSPKENHNERG